MTARSGRRPGRLLAAGLLTAALWGCGDEGATVDVPASDVLAARIAGESFLVQDRLDEAEAEFRRLVEWRPDEPAGHSLLAVLSLRRGELEAARGSIARAIQLAPEDPALRVIQATIARESGDETAARAALRAALDRDSLEVRALWGLAATAPDSVRADHLARIAARAGGNVAARLALADALLAAARPDSAAGALERLRQIAPEAPSDPASALQRAIDEASAGRVEEAEAALADYRRYLELTGDFQAGMEQLRLPPGEIVGVPELRFSHEFSLEVQSDSAVRAALRFQDAAGTSGLAALARAAGGRADAPLVAAVGDADSDGDSDVVLGGPGGARVLSVELGTFVASGAELPGADALRGITDVALIDLDNDGTLDPVVAHERGITWFPGAPGARRAMTLTGSERMAGGRLYAGDLDQDGDLDLLRAGEQLESWRANGDGTFVEGGATAGLVATDVRSVSLADLDDDLDLDVVVATAAGGAWFRNERGGRFTRQAFEADGAGSPLRAVAAVELNGDGRIDLVAAPEAGGLEIRTAEGDGGFSRPARIVGPPVLDLVTLDYDNDGHLDLAVAEASGVRLLRNDGRAGFADGPPLDGPGGLSRLSVMPYNDDGDPDLLATGAGGIALFRNDGGSAHHYLDIDLVGLGTGSGKNNRFGIGARVEVRAGDLLQVRTVTTPGVHFGLGGHLKADVVRVKWPNGVVQDLYFPGTDQDLVEQQQLKGSCPLLYAWNGERFEFVTDVMWRSALGMPLGILGGTGERTYAPAFPSQEYIRLPEGALAPRNGRYVIQITEELWETIYIDQVELVAVDHPADVEVRVDEGFRPPAPAELELLPVTARYAAAAAVDGHGRDMRARLAEADFAYVDRLVPSRFQGLMEPHELILAPPAPDQGGPDPDQPLMLFLTGWVFPGDASINVALAQTDSLASRFPVFDVPGPDGTWRQAGDVAIPSGKQKTVAVDLRGVFPTDDRRVRVRTNLQVYWDEAFFGVVPEATAEPVEVHRLVPAGADLHYRGFSRTFRRGGRYGPHWFDYGEVSTAPRWQDLAGRYTRFGDVTPLLQGADDMYVIANAGDETTIEFDAAELPPLRPGWDRTWLLYTDGWVKDGDLNTATGSTVGPMPYRGQPEYPYQGPHGYPADPEHRAYQARYNTREVRPPFGPGALVSPSRGDAPSR